ncbi:MAG: C40 family peptidase [Nocardioidaceae bacterium]
MNSAKVMLVVAAAGSALVTLVGLCVVAGSLGTANSPSGMLAGSVCATSGPLPGLSKAAAANARTVAATALARGGRQAALIALMTGLTESGLRVLTNPNDPGGSLYPSQGVGHDHDSLGIFQQRPSWGSAAQRMDPVVSTGLFLDRLLAQPDWRAESPWQAAQAVQVSAFADGSNYRANLDRAAMLLNDITATASPADCGGAGVGDPPSGPRGPHGLPLHFRLPAATSRPAAAAVHFALGQLGDPYAWGAEGPNAYDCSGLMQAAWQAADVPLTRTTSTQVHDGRPTTPSNLAPGDLVFIPGYDGTLASPGHVGMFIGHGLVVEAPKTGDVVKVVSYDEFVSAGLAEIRHID